VAVSYLTFKTFFVQHTFPTKLTGEIAFLTEGLADLTNPAVLLTSLFSAYIILPFVD
jgi:hypothetical protein